MGTLQQVNIIRKLDGAKFQAFAWCDPSGNFECTWKEAGKTKRKLFNSAGSQITSLKKRYKMSWPS